jgi:hypothetical protein
MAEKVERRALGGQQGPGSTAGQRDVGGNRVAPLALRLESLEGRGPGLGEDLPGRLEPVHDARLLLHDPRGRGRIRGHHRLGGDVAGAEVLHERAGDQVFQFLAI